MLALSHVYICTGLHMGPCGTSFGPAGMGIRRHGIPAHGLTNGKQANCLTTSWAEDRRKLRAVHMSSQKASIRIFGYVT